MSRALSLWLLLLAFGVPSLGMGDGPPAVDPSHVTDTDTTSPPQTGSNRTEVDETQERTKNEKLFLQKFFPLSESYADEFHTEITTDDTKAGTGIAELLGSIVKDDKVKLQDFTKENCKWQEPAPAADTAAGAADAPVTKHIPSELFCKYFKSAVERVLSSNGNTWPDKPAVSEGFKNAFNDHWTKKLEANQKYNENIEKLKDADTNNDAAAKQWLNDNGFKADVLANYATSNFSLSAFNGDGLATDLNKRHMANDKNKDLAGAALSTSGILGGRKDANGNNAIVRVAPPGNKPPIDLIVGSAAGITDSYGKWALEALARDNVNGGVNPIPVKEAVSAKVTGVDSPTGNGYSLTDNPEKIKQPTRPRTTEANPAAGASGAGGAGGTGGGAGGGGAPAGNGQPPASNSSLHARDTSFANHSNVSRLDANKKQILTDSCAKCHADKDTTNQNVGAFLNAAGSIEQMKALFTGDINLPIPGFSQQEIQSLREIYQQIQSGTLPATP